MNYWYLAIFFLVSCTEPGGKKLKDSVDRSAQPFYALSLEGRAVTLHTVSQEKARQARKNLESSKKADKGTLTKLIALGRWSHEPFESIKRDLSRLADLEMKKGIDKSVSDYVKFDALIAAYYSQKWSEFFIGVEELSASSNKQVQSLVLNLRGVLALKEKRIPEAGALFQEALNQDPKSEAAILNLAFLNLRFSYASEAEKLLLKVPQDPLAQSGLIITSYLQEKNSDADKRCKSFLEAYPKHKPTLFNCAQIAWYAFQDKKRALALMQKFTQLPSLEKSWEEEALKFMNSLKTSR